MKTWLYLCTSVAFLMAVPNGSAEVAPVELKCEYLKNPQGIDVVRPRLSWIVRSDERGRKQGAYRILVAGSPEDLAAERGNLWDTGKVPSDRSFHKEYSGKPLESRMRCHWKVRVWDDRDRASAWSRSACWSMGLLDRGDWQADWVGGPEGEMGKMPSSLWLRKTFSLETKPESAEVFLATIGYSELYVNGTKVGDEVLSPPVCDYRHRALYTTHNVTDHLVAGKNCIAVWLGRGWAAHKPYQLRRGPMVKVQLEACLDGQRRRQIVSDATWKSHPTPITYIGQWRFNDFGGERYDATRELPGWNLPSLDDSSWADAGVFKSPVPKLSAAMVQPNRIIETFHPVAVRKLAPGAYVIDMGRNYTGWFEIDLEGPRGRMIQFDYSERPVEKPGQRTFNQYDQYVLRGESTETFRNRFNYHAFRWVTVTGIDRPPPLDAIEGHLIHTDYPRCGEFECSNPLFNRIYQTVLWTYRCLTLGAYVVDCPHRERLGYGAEGQVAIETALYNFDQGAMFSKWMTDWRDVQDPVTGQVPHTAPTYKGGGGPAWGGIVVTLPWQCYLHYGDRRILDRCYPTMQGYLRWLDSKSEDHVLQPFGGPWDFLADWVAPGRNVAPNYTWTPEDWRVFFNNAYLVYVTQLTARIAAVLGKPDDAETYRRKAEQINRAVHARFFDPAKQSYVNGESPYLALALLVGMVPPGQRAAVMANLQRDILVEHTGHVHSGVLGTWLLLEFLTAADHSDLIFPMVNQKNYPSWGHMLDQGATTIWERWNGDASQNHTSFLSVGAWFTEGVAGIRPDEASPGFRHFIVRPAVVGDLTFARASYRSILGRISSHWRIDSGRFFLDVEVPVGATASIHVPVRRGEEVLESGKPAESAPGVRLLRRGEDSAVYGVGSGSYSFQSYPNSQ